MYPTPLWSLQNKGGKSTWSCKITIHNMLPSCGTKRYVMHDVHRTSMKCGDSSFAFSAMTYLPPVNWLNVWTTSHLIHRISDYGSKIGHTNPGFWTAYQFGLLGLLGFVPGEPPRTRARCHADAPGRSDRRIEAVGERHVSFKATLCFQTCLKAESLRHESRVFKASLYFEADLSWDTKQDHLQSKCLFESSPF